MDDSTTFGLDFYMWDLNVLNNDLHVDVHEAYTSYILSRLYIPV